MVMFPVQLRVVRQKTTATGSQSADGVWTPAAGTNVDVLYDGMADVQDVIEKEMRDLDAGPTKQADAVIFLNDETGIVGIATDDRCELTYPSGREEQAVVVSVRRIDGSLLVQRVRLD